MTPKDFNSLVIGPSDVELFCLYRVCRSSYRRSLSEKEYKKEGCKNKFIHPRELDEAFLCLYGGRKGYRDHIEKMKLDIYKKAIGKYKLVTKE